MHHLFSDLLLTTLALALDDVATTPHPVLVLLQALIKTWLCPAAAVRWHPLACKSLGVKARAAIRIMPNRVTIGRHASRDRCIGERVAMPVEIATDKDLVMTCF